MTYKLTNTTSIIRMSDGAGIPLEPTLVGYQEYLAWANLTHTEETTTPLIYSEAVPEVPATLDEEGNELTPYIPAVDPVVIGGGEVVIIEVPNVPEPADEIVVPVEVPIVSAWQIRKALNAAGLREAVEAAVAAADITVKDAWQYSNEFHRDNPLVIGLGLALGKTEEELDQVFALAKTL